MTDADVTRFTDIFKRMYHLDHSMRDGMYLLRTQTTAKRKFYSAYEDLENAIYSKERSRAVKAADMLDAFVDELAHDIEKLEFCIASIST